jgi:O-antigen/teichoic acid export membrane protein
LLLIWQNPNLIAWGKLYLLSSAVAAIYSLVVVSKLVGWPSFNLRSFRGQLKEGFYFAVSQSSLTLHNDIDKTMLVRLAGLEATGIYGAAYRIGDVAFAPVSALVYASLARFFRRGQAGISEAIRLAKRLMAYSTAYGAIAALGLYLAAPVLPKVIGHDFAKSVVALRWLCPIVLIRAIHYFLANALSGSGYQGSRTLAQLAVVGVNIVVNLCLIPRYSWRGAAWSSLLCDSLLVFALLVVIKFWQSRCLTSENIVQLGQEALS